VNNNIRKRNRWRRRIGGVAALAGARRRQCGWRGINGGGGSAQRNVMRRKRHRWRQRWLKSALAAKILAWRRRRNQRKSGSYRSRQRNIAAA